MVKELISPPPEVPPWEQMRIITKELQAISATTKELQAVNVNLNRLISMFQPKPPLEWPKGEPYNILEYPLEEARAQEEILWVGDTITASTDGTLAGITIKFASKSHDAIPLQRFNPVNYPDGFKQFYLSNTAQEGKKLWLFLGRAAGASTATEITATAPKPLFYTVKSDKDLHFTGALVQYAKEDESLTGLLGNKIRILDVAIQADQALDLWLMFWRKSTFSNSDLDIDAFIGAVQLDLSTFGKQVGGAGQYYHSIEDANLDYEDEDGVSSLHVSLYNADAVSKNAGATGEVVCFFKYELRG